MRKLHNFSIRSSPLMLWRGKSLFVNLFFVVDSPFCLLFFLLYRRVDCFFSRFQLAAGEMWLNKLTILFSPLLRITKSLAVNCS
jgi:hypothetical protein